MRIRLSDGPERLWDELAAEGFHAGVGRIKRLRKHLGIPCIQTRKFKATTHFNYGLPVAQDLLQQDFSSERPSQVWLTDITSVST